MKLCEGFRIADRVWVDISGMRTMAFSIMGFRYEGEHDLVAMARIRRLPLGPLAPTYWYPVSSLRHADDAITRLGRIA